MEDLFIKTINKLELFRTSDAFTPEQNISLGEAISRLKIVKTKSLKIINKNSVLLDKDPKSKLFRN